MVYNYYLETAALIIMLFILLHFVINRQFPVARTKLFFCFLITSMLACAFNIASSIGCEYKDSIPVWLNEFFAFSIFLYESLDCYLFFMYTIQVCNREKKWRRTLQWTGFFPCALMLVVTILTPFTDWLYYFDADRIYRQGPLNGWGFFLVAAYAVAEFVMLSMNRKRIRENNRVVIGVYLVLIFSGTILQFFFRELLLNGIVRTNVILLIYLSMQNPGTLVDGASGRYNELAFRAVADDKIRRGKAFTALHLHLNKFHSISSVIGYKNVDSILEQVGNFLAEIGGEENTYRTEAHVFALILPEDEIAAERIISLIEARFREKWHVGKLDLVLNANIVVAGYPQHFASVSEMDALREYMMERAKARGTNSLVMADEEIARDYARLNSVERAIARAIENDSLQVHFQPIYSVKEGRLVAAEALARLVDEELGNVPPGEFIPIAEKNGTIIELGRQIFEKCCRFIADELVPRPELGIESIHINLSVVQCLQPDMSEQFIRLIEIYKVPPGMLNLELTERITLDATELMKIHMKRLGSRGVKFSLDDYGTGSSNCSYLIDYAFRMVKFDKKMMDSYFENKEAYYILSNEFKTLRELGISIVAEGIETEEQVKRLTEVDMNYIQGYYFAKPAPAAQFLNVVRQQNL
ncbi:MAG: EAL domain-containing protein [Lachnospiraceae bacterium]|nr:EAL domain-containing protein [Lachnospiraceae bacterium]